MSPKPFISYSQNGEDIVIARVLADVTDGFYVDVGAGDPIGYSATYALYLEGWRGINVEPVRGFADALRAVRPRDITLETAVGDTTGSIDLNVVAGTGLSTASAHDADRVRAHGFRTEVMTVEMQTLDDVLARYRKPIDEIHLLKVDVEGMEEAVLRGIDLGTWRPWLIVVEATEPLSQLTTHDRWEEILTSANYGFHLFDGLNRYYLAAEHEHLGGRLTHGPCVFDQPYQRADVSIAIERHRELIADDLAAARIQIAELSGVVDQLRNLLDEKQTSNEALVALLTEERERFATLAAERDQYHDAYRAVHTQVGYAHAEIDRLSGALTATQLELDQASSSANELSAQRESEAAHARALRGELDMLTASLSWRVTKPLRVARSRLGDGS